MSSEQELFTQIAREHLGIETLEARNRDSLDFHEIGVAAVRKALEAAYRAGAASANEQPDAPRDENAVPNTEFVIGQHICCEPMGEDGHIVGYEDDGFILIIDLVNGGTEHVPAGDCVAR